MFNKSSDMSNFSVLEFEAELGYGSECCESPSIERPTPCSVL